MPSPAGGPLDFLSHDANGAGAPFALAIHPHARVDMPPRLNGAGQVAPWVAEARRLLPGVPFGGYGNVDAGTPIIAPPHSSVQMAELLREDARANGTAVVGTLTLGDGREIMLPMWGTNIRIVLESPADSTALIAATRGFDQVLVQQAKVTDNTWAIVTPNPTDTPVGPRFRAFGLTVPQARGILIRLFTPSPDVPAPASLPLMLAPADLKPLVDAMRAQGGSVSAERRDEIEKRRLHNIAVNAYKARQRTAAAGDD